MKNLFKLPTFGGKEKSLRHGEDWEKWYHYFFLIGRFIPRPNNAFTEKDIKKAVQDGIADFGNFPKLLIPVATSLFISYTGLNIMLRASNALNNTYGPASQVVSLPPATQLNGSKEFQEEKNASKPGIERKESIPSMIFADYSKLWLEITSYNLLAIAFLLLATSLVYSFQKDNLFQSRFEKRMKAAEYTNFVTNYKTLWEQTTDYSIQQLKDAWSHYNDWAVQKAQWYEWRLSFLGTLVQFGPKLFFNSSILRPLMKAQRISNNGNLINVKRGGIELTPDEVRILVHYVLFGVEPDIVKHVANDVVRLTYISPIADEYIEPTPTSIDSDTAEIEEDPNDEGDFDGEVKESQFSDQRPINLQRDSFSGLTLAQPTGDQAADEFPLNLSDDTDEDGDNTNFEDD